MKVFLNILANASAVDLVFSSISVILIIFGLVLLISNIITSKKERKRIEQYLNEKKEKIDFIKLRITISRNLDQFHIVKRWATAAVENMRTEMVEISYDYGLDYGNRLIKEIKNCISLKEEDLTKDVVIMEI